MRNPRDDAALALVELLKLALSKDALALFGKDLATPVVSYGIGARRPPCLVWVNPLARGASTDGGATSHEHRMGWYLYAYMLCTHQSLTVATMTVSYWEYAAEKVVAADPTLMHTVDNAIPRLSDSGYDVTPDKKHVAVAELEVACSVFADCPREFKELVR